ncbi:alpha/beta fold hydrolase [Longispora albida]|uniref:alpha/beta fold hydrolase n=1 Tax=Longispora albida TaxID=203523 RepID=UPI00036AAED4|nr:alpha/beta hydrolase [Longispora albida]
MTTKYQTAQVDGLDVFYREAGDPARPAIVLLHGFPSSSVMFRDLIERLAGEYHVIAPDHIGFGHSAMPSPGEFSYTFDRLTEITLGLLDQLGLGKFAVYVQDYGAPIGFRIASRHPERVTAIVSQSGNAYMEGFTDFWKPLFEYATKPGPDTEPAVRELLTVDATRWQYTHGEPDTSLISPDTWQLDQSFLDRPGNQEIQLLLFQDYRFNLDGYPAFQQYFREHQPPLLAVWGRNDEIFGAPGAEAFARDLPDAEIHLLDAGHFALNSQGERIAALILGFLGRHLPAAEGE